MSTALSVNLNKIALLRNSREGNYPNILEFAEAAIAAGAQGITVHPRPDKRHIHPRDVFQLKTLLSDTPQYEQIEFNIEGNPFEEAVFEEHSGLCDDDRYTGFMDLIEKTRPHQATLVPDNSTQLTSDHGFNLIEDGESLLPIIRQLKAWGVRVSVFMDPDIQQIEQAKALGADRIELYTGPYAAQYTPTEEPNSDSWQQYYNAAVYAHSIGLGVNAGHDLNLENLPHFLTIPHIAEVSIGHALTVDALLMGYTNTVAAYSKICHLDYTV